jgi:hypothetical protein
MPSLYDIVMQLTSASAMPEADRMRMLNDFAYHFGWTPSDTLDISTVNNFANAHLVVEHGLENTAVITFLRRRFSDLSFEEKKRLLNISYNNLVDWHIQIEPEQIVYVFNRNYPELIVETRRLSRDDLEGLRSKAFEQISGKRQSPNLPALDDALINTISFWKRYLSAEMENEVSNRELSHLFNAVIFVRAVEDNFRRLHSTRTGESLRSQALLEAGILSHAESLTIREIIFDCLERFDQKNVPDYLVDGEILKVFDGLNEQTTLALLGDFYRIKHVRPYEYDFSVMSKHALSRIYERYTNLLRIVPAESKAQGVLFHSPLPEETTNRSYGSVYTPQFIARFFARYLYEQMPPFAFKRLRTLEPSIGSGIFLRTLLEVQCDPTQGRVTTELIEAAFENIIGLDSDPNACHAALLSLSLLHLVLTNHLPRKLDIYAEEAILYFQEHPELKTSRDVVLSNPPFIPWPELTPVIQERLSEFMDEDASGRIDLYLAFLKIALEVLKPGGYGLFVLPHNFLLGNNAWGIRKLIAETCWIRCLADLSAVRVFEDTGVYVVLLIIQKRLEVELAPKATIVKCQELVGQALQHAIEGHQIETRFFSVFDVEQGAFEADEWLILPHAELTIKRKLEALPKLGDFLEIHKGLITGRDKVFIIPQEIYSKVEKKLFVPFLPDKEITPYSVPEKTGRFVFYPYIKGRKIEEDVLKEKYPKTWRYLLEHKDDLEDRPPVRRGQLLWWQPERPRTPEQIMRPKIVSPHLVIVPRFSLDREGNYAITQAPLMYPKAVITDDEDLLEFDGEELEAESEDETVEAGAEDDLLRFFVAVLNSSICYRYIYEQSHKYGGGYAKLEPRTLAKTPVPDPNNVPPTTMRQLLTLVDKRLIASGSDIITIETEIDQLVTELYGLTPEERIAIGISK